jgi:2-polyprenyl-3-methyl-5-hydroxy-6-metoxy-1,4-benzoquinol methylase
MTDYELEYRRNLHACGEPFAEIVSFFNSRSEASLAVLDLGCGQGRDALMIASMGHRVHGVDIAPSGIAQMLESARRSGWDVTGEVADLTRYRPTGKYDVVLLDRVVHMLGDIESKRALLKTAAQAVSPNGWALVVETPSNLSLVEETFRPERWAGILRRKGFRFFRRRDNGTVAGILGNM